MFKQNKNYSILDIKKLISINFLYRLYNIRPKIGHDFVSNVTSYVNNDYVVYTFFH